MGKFSPTIVNLLSPLGLTPVLGETLVIIGGTVIKAGVRNLRFLLTSSATGIIPEISMRSGDHCPATID